MKRREHVSCAHHETEFLVTTMIVLVTPAEMFSESEGCLKSLEFLIFLTFPFLWWYWLVDHLFSTKILAKNFKSLTCHYGLSIQD